MALEAAFIGLLLADASITAVVGQRVHPVFRTQGEALPAIVCTRISGQPGYADDGEIGLETARMQVDCWGETYGAAKGLADIVRARLSAFEGVFSGVNFSYIMLDEVRDLREIGSNQPEYLFRVAMDFIVHVRG